MKAYSDDKYKDKKLLYVTFYSINRNKIYC
jgi:hypothetical protein